MNIVHAFLFFSVRFAGGTSDLMFKICKTQEKQGLQPIVLTGDYNFDYELAKRLKKTKFSICKTYLNALGFSLMPNLYFKLRKEMHGYDIIHMHVFRTFQNILLYYFCRKYNKPYIIDAHGAVPYYINKVWLKKIFDKLIGFKMLDNAAAIVVETNVGITEYKEVYPQINEKKIKVLSPPFDTDEFESLPMRGDFRRSLRIKDDEKLIMFLGRIHHIKGNDFLIKGFAEFLKHNNNCKLVLVGGDDGHMDECKQISKELKVDKHVIFAGFLDGGKKISSLVDADIVAQMSRYEQGAWAPFEAVLCGTPIVVTKHTGSGEDVERINAGYTVEFDDVSGLAKTFQFIFDNYDEAKKKTAEAREYIINHMSMNTRASEYTELYKNCINKHTLDKME